MKPETVLALQSSSDPKTVLDKWIEEYDCIAEDHTDCGDICIALKKRAEIAYALYMEHAEYVPTACCDEAYYDEFAESREREDASLDGNFPLGNETDAVFANDYFTISELARIQCGLHRLIAPGDFNGYNFDTLVHRGFLAELDGDFAEAARCYGGVSTSKSVQEREYDCRLKAAANEGNADSAWKAAQLCKNQNKPEEAAEWFNKAIETGYPEALFSAASVYLDVDGDFYDRRKGVRLLTRAADSGSTQAMLALGDLALTNTNISFWQQAAQLRNYSSPGNPPKRRIIKQHKKQMEWYIVAAESGNTDAMSALGMAYHLGYPEKRDDEQAFLWASRAADSGNAEAVYQTAYFYENGFGTEKDIGAALLLYAEAAEAGVRSAAVRLHEIYTDGIPGVQPDGQKAVHYLFLSGGSDSEEEHSET